MAPKLQRKSFQTNLFAISWILKFKMGLKFWLYQLWCAFGAIQLCTRLAIPGHEFASYYHPTGCKNLSQSFQGSFSTRQKAKVQVLLPMWHRRCLLFDSNGYRHPFWGSPGDSPDTKVCSRPFCCICFHIESVQCWVAGSATTIHPAN